MAGTALGLLVLLTTVWQGLTATYPQQATYPHQATPCPPAEGLATGLVVIIACFAAVGGALLGMLLTVKCCPVGKGSGWFGRPPPPGCKGCAAVSIDACGNGMCQAPRVALPPALPAASCSGGRCNGPFINTYNDVYTVNGVLD